MKNSIDDDIDKSLSIFKTIKSEVDNYTKDEWSEADTRIKVIDRILFEVLGWNKCECAVESKSGNGFADYSLKHENCTKVIVEAKRECIPFGTGNRTSGRAYKLDGQSFNSEAKSAIDQAIKYSAFKGAELACVTNGNEWIIFRANRLGDGQNVLDGKGFIFNSMDSLNQEFQKFYDLLSLNSVSSLNFRGEFQTVEGVPIRDLSYLEAPTNPDSKQLLDRGEFATDFDAITSTFFERLKGEDPEMITKCYVVSPESEFADQKLLRLTSELVEKVKPLNSQTGEQLVKLIWQVKKTRKQSFILLVGNKGAGKSTFIDRFFQYVLPDRIRSYVKTIRVDLAKSSGNSDQIVHWLDRELLKELEASIFTNHKENNGWNELIGKIFFDEYQRWSNYTMAHLYKNNKDEFKIEFGRHIEKIREERPNDYIKRLIAFLTKSSLKVPCVIFDNTDHFSINFQENVFQFARALYETEFCVIIMPVTDKTSWQLSKQGAFQSFENESLFLSGPKPEKIIERRIAFLTEKLEESRSTKDKGYFLNKGIELKLDNIAGFISSLNQIFVNSPRISEWIGGLVNNDIRRLLEFTRDTIASPHLDLDDLLKAHIAGSTYSIPQYKIKNAVIKKRYNIYPVGEHSFVQNVFSINSHEQTTPILSLRIIQYLIDATSNVEDDSVDFIAVNKIYDYFSNLGITQVFTRSCLAILLNKGLILNFDPTVKELNLDCKLEAAPSGKVHLDWATNDRNYLGIMKDITPIRDRDVVRTIRSSYKDYRNQWAKSFQVFVDYLIAEDKIYCEIPDHRNFERQQIILQKLQILSCNLGEEACKN